MKKSLLFFLSLLITNYLITNCCFAQEKPDLTIISPQEGETIFGDKAIFSFFVSNFLLGIDGYLRVSFDQKEPFTIKEQKDFPLTNFSEGKHTLIAEVVDKKTQSLSPVVKKEVSFLSIFPKEEKGVNSEVSPPEPKETKILMIFSLILLGSAAVIFLILTFKFYVGSKASKNRPYQKPLG